MKRRLLLLAAALTLAPACLVLQVNPLYDDDSLTWEPGLVGAWAGVEDQVTLEIDRDEWRSYNIRYVHPGETGHVTGYLTVVGDHRYLDVMPMRGEDRGAFLVPVHAFLHVRLDGDRLHLTPVAYDWLADRLRMGALPDGLDGALDQKENVLIVSPPSGCGRGCGVRRPGRGFLAQRPPSAARGQRGTHGTRRC